MRRAEAEAEDDNTLAEIARQFMVKYAAGMRKGSVNGSGLGFDKYNEGGQLNGKH